MLAGCLRPPEGHHHVGPLYTPPDVPACVAGSDAAVVVACPIEAEGPVPGPHRGIESFYRLAADRPEDAWQGLTTAYYRVWWDELEPTEGAIAFDVLDALVDDAAAQGQTVSLRVMPEEGAAGRQAVPDWLAEAAGGAWGSDRGRRYFSPDYASPAYLDAVRATAGALGARYDGRLESFDVGFVGDAGEWAYTNGAVPMPGADVAAAIIDAVRDAWPTTAIGMNVGAVDDGGAPLAHAIARGAGWRADCWGDLRGGWSHHDDFYDGRITEAGAADAWRTAPVALETCGDVQVWARAGYDEDQLRWVLAWALAQHASRVNVKSNGIPDEWRASFEEFLTFVGYRLVVHEVRAERRGDELAVTVGVANRGVAPFYRPLRLAVRARAGGAIVASGVGADALDGLVDAAQVTVDLEAPPGAAIEVALVDLEGDVAAPLANLDVDGGWLPVVAAAP